MNTENDPFFDRVAIVVGSDAEPTNFDDALAKFLLTAIHGGGSSAHEALSEDPDSDTGENRDAAAC